MNQVGIKTQKTQISSIFVQRPLWESCSKFYHFFPLTSLLLKIFCKTLCNFPIEVSARKCLKFGVSEFLSLLNLLPLRKNCTSTPGFRNIGVKYWVLVLKTLRVARIMDLSVFPQESGLLSQAGKIAFCAKNELFHIKKKGHYLPICIKDMPTLKS